MKKTVRRKYNNQLYQDTLRRDNDLLLRCFHRQKGNNTQANSPTEFASWKPPTSMNEICDDSQQLAVNQRLSIHRDRLQQIALTKGKRIQGFLNVRVFNLNISPPLTINPNISSDTSLVIQNPINEANQWSQPEVPQSPPADESCPEILPAQKLPGPCSEVEYAPVVCLDPTPHRDSTIEETVVDGPSEANDIDQDIFDGLRAEDESSAVSNYPKNVNQLDQSMKSTVEKEPTQMDVVISSDVLSTHDFDGDDRSNSPEMNSEEMVTDIPSSNEPTDPSVGPNVNRTDILADKLFNVVQQLKVDFSEICQVTDDMQKSFAKSQTIFTIIADASKNLRELAKRGVIVTAEKETADVQPEAEKNQVDPKKNENSDVDIAKNDGESKQSIENDYNHTGDNDCNDNDANDNDGNDNDTDNSTNTKGKNKLKSTLKTTRGNIRSFVLPPEYDPNDTRWTLKYRENDPELNLVELIPGRNVFIDSIKLANCKQVTKDAKALARMLLVEIFSVTALSVCSFTGAKANAFDMTGTNVRPGLDENARMTILSYIEEYSTQKNWGAFDSQAIINSLRSKIQEIRAKNYKSEVVS